jgi:hypothetical protein
MYAAAAVNFNKQMLPTGRKFGGKTLKNQIKTMQFDLTTEMLPNFLLFSI